MMGEQEGTMFIEGQLASLPGNTKNLQMRLAPNGFGSPIVMNVPVRICPSLLDQYPGPTSVSFRITVPGALVATADEEVPPLSEGSLAPSVADASVGAEEAHLFGELCNLKQVGPGFARLAIQGGVKTPAALLAMSIDDLANMLQCRPRIAEIILERNK